MSYSRADARAISFSTGTPSPRPPTTRENGIAEHRRHPLSSSNGGSGIEAASPTTTLESGLSSFSPSSSGTFLEPPTGGGPRRRQQSSISTAGSGSSTKRNRSWLGRKIGGSRAGSNGGVMGGQSGRGGSSGDEEDDGDWVLGNVARSSEDDGPLLPSHTPPLYGSRPPSRAKRRRDRDKDRIRNLGRLRLSHPADRSPISIRSVPAMILHPTILAECIWRIIVKRPWLMLYLLVIILVGLSPLTTRIPRKSYGFLVRPYPEPTDVMAFLQKNVFTRGGWLHRWTTDRHHLDHNRHFMWQFPIDELIDAKGPEEFDPPVLSQPERRTRRSLGELRPDGWEDEAEPTSGWDAVTVREVDSAKPSRTMAIRQGWKRDLAAGIPLDDAAHRSPFFHELHVNTSLHHYKDDLDLITPAFLALHTFSTAGSAASRAERDLVRRYQRTRLPREYYHLVDFQFVICSPFGVHEYGYHLDPKAKSNVVGGGRGQAYRNWGPVQQRKVWEELKAEQEEFGDILIVDEMEMTANDDGAGGGGRQRTMKENMDYGKTYGWMREVARRADDGRGRKAMFVMKTDADAYHVLPNLLNFLLDYDPSKPVYFGSTLGTHYAANMYMQGLGYGFSWPLLQSLVRAELPADVICGLEDHITGSWMYSLPASRRVRSLERAALRADPSHAIGDRDLRLQTFWSPDAPAGEGNCIKAVPETCVKPVVRRTNDRRMPKWVTRYARRVKHSAYEVLDRDRTGAHGTRGLPRDDDGGARARQEEQDMDHLHASDLSTVLPRRIIPDSLYAYDPPSPDPYTGLIRADMYERASSWWYWWAPKTERLITAHGMKTRKEYLDAYEKLEGFWLRPHWIGQRAHSVPYWWDPPIAWLKDVAEAVN